MVNAFSLVFSFCYCFIIHFTKRKTSISTHPFVFDIYYYQTLGSHQFAPLKMCA